MRTWKISVSRGTLLLAFVAAPLDAQRRPIEFGTDAMVAYHEIPGPDNFWELSGPIGSSMAFLPRVLQGFRVGFFLADRFSFEPSVGLNYLSDEEGDNVTQFGLSSTLQLQLTDRLTGPFVGVGGSYNLIDAGGESVFQYGTHALVGGRAPITQNFYIRITGGAGYFYENDDFNEHWTYFGTVGISYTIGGATAVAMR